MATAAEAAQWMLDQVIHKKSLEQMDVADGIRKNFGSAFIYENDRGVDCIGKDVLKAFRKISTDTVVWERSERQVAFKRSRRSSKTTPSRLV
jgi:Family of unknown function (DUF6953)